MSSTNLSAKGLAAALPADAEKGLSVQACLELKELIKRQHAEILRKLDEALLLKDSCNNETGIIGFLPDSSLTHEDGCNEESEIIDIDVVKDPFDDDRTPEDCLKEEKTDSDTVGVDAGGPCLEVDALQDGHGPGGAVENAGSCCNAPRDCHDCGGRPIVEEAGPHASQEKNGRDRQISGVNNRISSKPIMSESSQRQLQTMTTCQKAIKSTTYELFVMTLVVANSIFIGLEMETIARARGSIGDASAPTKVEILFMICFATELCFRIAVDRHGFFFSIDRYWNYFDLAAVAALIAEPALEWISSKLASDASSDFSILRLIRIARLARLVRLIRVVRFFRELRLMLYSILGSFKSLLWVAIVLLLFVYIFAIALMGGAVDYLAREDAWERESTEFLRKKFGSLPASVLSLYEAIAGGISWTELVAALEPLHPLYLVFFFVFQSVAMFAVLNIVTGIFVDSAMSYSQNDQETQIQDEIANKEAQAAIIEQIFIEVDADASGQVTLIELQSAIQDPRMEAYFAALGIRPHSLKTLFGLLDADQTGEIEIGEFMDGCSKYKGQASGLELAHLGRQVADIADSLQKILGQVGVGQGASKGASASWDRAPGHLLGEYKTVLGNVNANSIQSEKYIGI